MTYSLITLSRKSFTLSNVITLDLYCNSYVLKKKTCFFHVFPRSFKSLQLSNEIWFWNLFKVVYVLVKIKNVSETVLDTQTSSVDLIVHATLNQNIEWLRKTLESLAHYRLQLSNLTNNNTKNCQLIEYLILRHSPNRLNSRKQKFSSKALD